MQDSVVAYEKHQQNKPNAGLTDQLHKDIYYIKVSGIASGNKLVKTIRYPHI